VTPPPPPTSSPLLSPIAAEFTSTRQTLGCDRLVRPLCCASVGENAARSGCTVQRPRHFYGFLSSPWCWGFEIDLPCNSLPFA
jgi:hypothetical protein